MAASFAVGLSSVFTPLCLLCILGGVFIGIIFGAVPGLSATMALALFLPVTYSMDSVSAVVLLTSLYIGGISGGLISAILTGIPGTPSSVATCFDGWPMTQKGQGVKALGVGVVASFGGSIFSTIILIFAAPTLAAIAIHFGNYEYFAIALVSLSMMCGLSGENIWKGLLSGLSGCMFATVGMDAIGAVRRYTFGSKMIQNGFDTLPVLIGLFAVAEIVSRVGTARAAKKEQGIDVDMRNIRGFGFSVKEAVGQIKNFLLCSGIGTAIGILPGIGGGAANVMAYTVSQQTSKHPEKYGTGIIDGVAATESSNNAAVGGALVPLLALGIPGDTVTAMLLGGLTLHGISAGPLMFTEHTDVVYSIFITMLIGSCVMLVMEFYGLRIFAKLLSIPKYYLLPAIFLCCVIGAYGTRHNMFDVWSVIVFGLIGFIFTKLKVPTAPFILGFIIGPLAENNLRRGLMFAQGDFGKFFTRPIACVFFAGALISFVFGIYKSVRPKKKKAIDVDD